jgi:hypothetical protein
VGFWLPTASEEKKNDQSTHGQTSPFKIKIKALPGSIVYHFSCHDISYVGFGSLYMNPTQLSRNFFRVFFP